MSADRLSALTVDFLIAHPVLAVLALTLPALVISGVRRAQTHVQAVAS